MNKKLIIPIFIVLALAIFVLGAPLYFTTNPTINSTLGTNLSNQDLFVSFIPRLNESVNINYSIQIFTNNISNFTLYNISTTNNTFTTFRINFSNLTRTQTWKAQIQLSNGSTLGEFINTTELLILNAIPTRPILNLPNNNSYFKYRDINFSINNSDDIDDEQTLYYILEISTDFVFTNTSIYNGTLLKSTNATNSYNITTNLSDGLYYWRARATDLVDNSSITEIRNFTIDTTNPTISLIYPTEGTQFTVSSVTFKYTGIDTNIANATLFIDNIPLKTNSSGFTSNVQDSYTNSTLEDGSHNWYVNARDLANNQINSSINTFLITTTIESTSGGTTSGGAGATSTNTTQPANQTETVQEITTSSNDVIQDIKNSTPESVRQFINDKKLILLLISAVLLYLGIIYRVTNKQKVSMFPTIIGGGLLILTLKPETSLFLTQKIPEIINNLMNKILPGISMTTATIVLIVLVLVGVSFISSLRKKKRI